MRAALWLLSLFAVAVAVALFAGNNQGTVTLYWPPSRIDPSLNLVLLLLAGLWQRSVAEPGAAAAGRQLRHMARGAARIGRAAGIAAPGAPLAPAAKRARHARRAARCADPYARRPLPARAQDRRGRAGARTGPGRQRGRRHAPCAPTARAGPHDCRRILACAARPRAARKPLASGPATDPGRRQRERAGTARRHTDA